VESAMIGTEEVKKSPATIAERSQKHRRRKKNKEMQLALSIARIIQGKANEEHRLMLKDYINKHTNRDDLDDDQLKLIDEVLGKLSARFNRF
jgi:hypothetical protein